MHGGYPEKVVRRVTFFVRYVIIRIFAHTNLRKNGYEKSENDKYFDAFVGRDVGLYAPQGRLQARLCDGRVAVFWRFGGLLHRHPAD